MRWLFADQLGPAFADEEQVLLILNRSAFARRRVHRAKAHLLVSAMLHRAQDTGVTLVIADSYREGLQRSGASDVEVIDPTSHGARRLVRRLGATVLPSRGFITSEEDFAEWAQGRRRLVLEDFYRHTRKRTGVLMNDDGTPEGGRWNFDADNRQPPPKAATLGVSTEFPAEDAIDAEAREILDSWERSGEVSFRGHDGPRRFAVTRSEALDALADFVANRLALFGPYEDAALSTDWVMAHSLLSVPMNLGLLDPTEAIDAVVAAFHRVDAPLASVEGFVRQVMGWRDYVWHLYWWFGEDYLKLNHLGAHGELPAWFDDLDGAAVQARCLRTSLDDVAEYGWSHHIIRLEVLGNWALQRGYEPAVVNRWFTEAFVDGTEWVMPANVIGMALYADGGQMATKPYAAGGAYINRMTDFCRGCPFKPSVRVGPQACPFTAGYWAFLAVNEPALRTNHRLRNPYATMRRLTDLDELIEQEAQRTEV